MDLIYLYEGLVIGFSVAAPIEDQLEYYGIAAGLGAATANLANGLIAGLGLTFISTALAKNQYLFNLPVFYFYSFG